MLTLRMVFLTFGFTLLLASKPSPSLARDIDLNQKIITWSNTRDSQYQDVAQKMLRIAQAAEAAKEGLSQSAPFDRVIKKANRIGAKALFLQKALKNQSTRIMAKGLTNHGAQFLLGTFDDKTIRQFHKEAHDLKISLVDAYCSQKMAESLVLRFRK